MHDDPTPIYVGELPRSYSLVPAPVVINVCGVYPQVQAPVRVVLSLPFLDVPDVTMIPAKDEVERFLEGVHAHASDAASYWHCHAGINRSGFVAAAYLHLHRGMRIADAIETLRSKRSRMVLCNSVFERTLRQWYGRSDEQEFVPFSLEDYLSEARRHRELARAREKQLADES